MITDDWLWKIPTSSGQYRWWQLKLLQRAGLHDTFGLLFRTIPFSQSPLWLARAPSVYCCATKRHKRKNFHSHQFKSLKFCAMLCGIVSPLSYKTVVTEMADVTKNGKNVNALTAHLALFHVTMQCFQFRKKETNITRIMWITCIKILVLQESIWEKHSVAVPMFRFVVFRE